jgi:hypothetical protein
VLDHCCRLWNRCLWRDCARTGKSLFVNPRIASQTKPPQKYLFPHLQPPNTTAYEADRDALTAQFDAAAVLLADIQAETAAVRAAVDAQQARVEAATDAAQAAVAALRSGEAATRDELREIRSEVDSVRAMLPKVRALAPLLPTAPLTDSTHR